MDYSSKYGVGFLMSDHTVGVYFNDKTVIATKQDNTTDFWYKSKVGTSEPVTLKFENVELLQSEI